MELIVLLALFWSLGYAVERAKQQWRHTQDGYARQITRANPGWHPRRVRRHARRRALSWWGHEVAEGLPTIRHAWAEDRDHVRYLREHARITRETKIPAWRAELAKIRAKRAEYQAARLTGETGLAFGEWYQRNAAQSRRASTPRREDARATPPDGEPAQTGGALSASQPNGATTPAGLAGTVPGRLVINDTDREALIRQLAAAAAGDDIGSWVEDSEPAAGTGPASGGASALSAPAIQEPAPGAAAQAADDFHAAVTKGRHADAAAAHHRYRAAVDAELAAGGYAATTQESAETSGQPRPQDPGRPAGEPNRNHDNGGDGMTAPNGELTGDSPYRAAFTALEGYDQVAQQHEQAAETLEAQLTLHGFDRDAELMEQIRGLRETAGQIRTRAAQARQVLTDHHATGDEYHRTGVDADATAFRS